MHAGISLGLGQSAQYRAAGGVSAIDPSTLSGLHAQFEMWDTSTMYTGITTGSPASTGDPVGRIDDKSVNGKTALRISTSTRATLRETGGVSYLEFDGGDDAYRTDLIDWGSDEATVFVAFRNERDTEVQNIWSFGDNENTDTGSMALFAPNATTGSGVIEWRSRGTGALNFINDSGFSTGVDRIVTSTTDISGAESLMYVDGAQEASGAPATGGNFGNYRIYIGGRSGLNFQPQMRLYAIIAYNRVLTESERLGVEAYIQGNMP